MKMTDKITVTYDLQDFPAHKKLRDAVLHPEVEKFLSALRASNWRVIDDDDHTVPSHELFRLAVGVTTADLDREYDAVQVSAQKAFKALCEPTK